MNTMLKIVSDEVGSFFRGFFAEVKNAFLSFGVSDVIDILLLALLLFLTFRFLRSRKAGVLLVGLAIIITLTVLTYVFKLQATYYIFSALLDVGVLAFIILFQPEIRGALEKMGSGSINGILNLSEQRKKRQIYYSAIDNICEAVKDLSANKTGALIVIVRTTKLDDILQTGVQINADVNSYLLRNLFFNNAPLHDGAVIIDEGRVAAAGCLLPLTRRSDVDGNLGTRHRAAIGVSETSDSITIVVSEETGVISVAYDCALTRNYTPETLKKFLMRKMLKNRGGDSDN